GDQIFFGFLTGQAGDALKGGNLLVLELITRLLRFLNLRKLAAEFFALSVQGIGLTIESLFLLRQTAFKLLRFIAALFDLPLGFCTGFMDLVLGLQDCLAFFCFASFNCIIDNAGGFLLSTADFFLGYLLAVQAAGHYTNNQSDNTDDQSDYGIDHSFCETPPGNFRLEICKAIIT